MVYDRLSDGDQCSYENFGLQRPRFLATRHLRNETKNETKNSQCYSWMPYDTQ